MIFVRFCRKNIENDENISSHSIRSVRKPEIPSQISILQRKFSIYSENKAYYKKVAPRVDCRWAAGTPRIRKGSWVHANRRLARRNTDGQINDTKLDFDSEADTWDDVFDEKPIKNEEISVVEEEESTFSGNDTNNTTSTSIESVSDHFHQLFDQLEDYMKEAPELDQIFIKRRINKMKDGMNTINVLFEEVLNTGIRLEKFLSDRQNNNNAKIVKGQK